jgi:transcriptional regulator with XRE-family HTH domain
LINASRYAFFPFGKNDMIENALQFGAAVASARKALGLTQRELALAINSGERFVVELEAGKPTAQLGKALAAARAVGLRLTATGSPQG